ncbi:LPS-assembly protein LptD [Trichinella spiralis]|uniref:LPS-assembly protein LptD n=1 Tax=Trichinella spiralis TaxID=6334 RepID=A0ABR3KRI0_TRISP
MSLVNCFVWAKRNSFLTELAKVTDVLQDGTCQVIFQDGKQRVVSIRSLTLATREECYGFKEHDDGVRRSSRRRTVNLDVQNFIKEQIANSKKKGGKDDEEQDDGDDDGIYTGKLRVTVECPPTDTNKSTVTSQAKEEAQQVLPNEEESDPKVVERKLREIGDFFQGREEWLRYKSGRLFCLACRRCQSMAKVSKKWTRIGMPIEMYLKFMEHENSVVHKKSMDRLFDIYCCDGFMQKFHSFVHRLDISPIFSDDSLEIADAHPYSSLSKSINRKDCLPSDPETVTSVSHESDDCKNSANFTTESENDIINEEKIDKNKLDMEAGMEIDCMLTKFGEEYNSKLSAIRDSCASPEAGCSERQLDDEDDDDDDDDDDIFHETLDVYQKKVEELYEAFFSDRCESFTCDDALELCRSLEEMDPS